MADKTEGAQRRVPVRPTLDEGNVPGTPSTRGIGIAVVVLLVVAGFIYLGTSFAPSKTVPMAPVRAAAPSK